MAREAGWAKQERNRVFAALLAGLKAADLPAEPQPADYERHEILVLKGPSTWVRYFVRALPSTGLLFAGLYIPKQQHGAAVHALLLRDEGSLSEALGGGPILQHDDVQREFRHFVQWEHAFRESTVQDAVAWCVARLSGAKKFVEAHAELGNSKALRALREKLIAPTDDPAAFHKAVVLLLAESETERPKGNEKPPRKPAPPGERFVRDPEVAAFVLRRAGDTCELCARRAPFKRDDGTCFLEVHHLQRLADDGPDTVENAVAVCPNCHRLLHHGAGRAESAEKLRKKFGSR